MEVSQDGYPAVRIEREEPTFFMKVLVSMEFVNAIREAIGAPVIRAQGGKGNI